MELKVGKRYLIIQSLASNCVGSVLEIDADFESKEIDTKEHRLVSEIIINELSLSGEYVKFNNCSIYGLPMQASSWNRIDSINVLEELPDKKENNEVTQSNVYEKLLEVLTKVLDRKISKRKKCKK